MPCLNLIRRREGLSGEVSGPGSANADLYSVIRSLRVSLRALMARAVSTRSLLCCRLASCPDSSQKMPQAGNSGIRTNPGKMATAQILHPAGVFRGGRAAAALGGGVGIA